MLSASDRSDRLTAAGTAWSDRIAADTANAHLTYRVSAAGEGSVASRVRAGKHEFLVDEPGALAGDDAAASPVEYALGALLSCQIVVYRLYAQALGIRVDDIAIQSEADLDARRLFGIDGGGRAGFSDVRLGDHDHRPGIRGALPGATRHRRCPLPGARPLRERDAGECHSDEGLIRQRFAPAEPRSTAAASPDSMIAPPISSVAVGRSPCTHHAARMPMIGTSRVNGTTALVG